MALRNNTAQRNNTSQRNNIAQRNNTAVRNNISQRNNIAQRRNPSAQCTDPECAAARNKEGPSRTALARSADPGSLTQICDSES